MGCLLCWEEDEENLESYFFVLILDHIEGKNKRSFENIGQTDQTVELSSV